MSLSNPTRVLTVQDSDPTRSPFETVDPTHRLNALRIASIRRYNRPHTDVIATHIHALRINDRVPKSALLTEEPEYPNDLNVFEREIPW